MADTTNTPAMYTEAEALDEAVTLLTRRLRRLHREEYDAVVASLPEGVREAISHADLRADLVRARDERDGIPLCSRPWPSRFDDADDDDADDE
jgi:hypothetical protein